MASDFAKLHVFPINYTKGQEDVRYLSWIITLPLALFAVLFAISNRELVTLGLWPLPFTMEAPLYLASLLALVIGFLGGGIIAWFAQRHVRKLVRRQSTRIKFLEAELRDVEERAATAEKRLAEMARPVSGMPVPAGNGSSSGSSLSTLQ